MPKPKLIGLTGRAGAGKSTVAEILAATEPIKMVRYKNPWAYILSILFGWKYEELCFIEITTDKHLIRSSCLVSNLPSDPVWHLSVLDAFEWTLSALETFDPLVMQHVINEFEAPESSETVSDWVQLSFADPLKKICVPLCGLSYSVLLGVDAAAREIREMPIAKIVPDFWHPTLSGRQLLEQIGTNVFRALDNEIWIKLAMRRISSYNMLGVGVVISDVRFKNEADMIRNAGGQLWILYRSSRDLVLTEQDKATHVSKWEFLTFITDKDRYVYNIGTIADLKRLVMNALEEP
jgi:hypothetical protein